MSTVPKMAKALADLIADTGSLSKEEARSWLADNDDQSPAPMSAGQINLTLGFGAADSRGWWHSDTDTDMLVPGPKQGSPAAAKMASKNGASEHHEDAPDVEELDDEPGWAEATPPEALLYEVARKVGVRKDHARIFAQYAAMTADTADPEQVAQSIQDCPEIKAPLKRRLYQAWVSSSGIAANPNIVKKYFANVAEKVEEVQAVQTAKVAASRHYIAVNGDVLLTTADDPDGLTIGEASRLAMIQQQKNGTLATQDQSILAVLLREQAETERARMNIAANQQPAPPDTGTADIITTVLREQGETSRKMMDLEEARRASQPTTKPEESFLAIMYREQAETERARIQANAANGQSSKSELTTLLAAQQEASNARMEAFMQRMEAMDREHALRMEALQKAHTQDMEIMRQQSSQQMETFNLQMQMERQQSAHEREIAAMQNQQDPDPLGPLNRLIPGLGDKLINSLLNPPKSEPAVTVSLGDGNSIPYETFERLENLKMKRQMLDMAVQNVPTFIEAGLKAASVLEAESQARASMGPMVQEQMPVEQLPQQPVMQTLTPQRVTPPGPPAQTGAAQGPTMPQPPRPPQIPNQRVPLPQPRAGEALEDMDPQGLKRTHCCVCGAGIAYPPGSEAFICPACETKQWVTGEVILEESVNTAPPAPPRPPRPQQASAPPTPPASPAPAPQPDERDNEQPAGLEYPPYMGSGPVKQEETEDATG